LTKNEVFDPVDYENRLLAAAPCVNKRLTFQHLGYEQAD